MGRNVSPQMETSRTPSSFAPGATPEMSGDVKFLAVSFLCPEALCCTYQRGLEIFRDWKSILQPQADRTGPQSPTGSPSLRGCSASRTLRGGAPLPEGQLAGAGGLLSTASHKTGRRSAGSAGVKELTPRTGCCSVLGLGEFPSLGIPKNGQRIPLVSALLLGRRESALPSPSRSGPSALPRLARALLGVRSHPPPASASFSATRTAEAGKGQGRDGRWGKETGYNKAFSWCEVLTELFLHGYL